jgi:mRNA-binding protein PUF3
MSSATTNRPAAAMAGAVCLNSSSSCSAHLADSFSQGRSTRFPEFGAASGRHNSDSSQSSTLGQTFGNGGSWQASTGIWGPNTIGSGFPNVKRDASRSRRRSSLAWEAPTTTNIKTASGKDDFLDGPSGSGALAASSEADPWIARTNGPWNPPDTTSPTLQSHSGSTSPSHTRNSIPTTTPQTLLEIQNQYQQSRPGMNQSSSFSRSQPKSNLDPSSGSFKFVRKPSFVYNDDKENSSQYVSNAENFDLDVSSRYLPIGSTASRDGSMPPSRASDSGGLNGGSVSFGNGNQPFGSLGHHTPNSSIHSQRPSFSGPSTSFPSQGNGSRYDPEAELSEKFGAFSLGREAEQSGVSHLNNIPSTSYSPNHPSFSQQSYPSGSASGMWGDGSKVLNNFEPYSNQPFADQVYFNKPAPRFTERGTVSPAGSDYRRGINSPKYYPAAGTPPSGSDQIYRPSSRGPRVPQGPSELDRRLQNIHYAQQAQAYMYGTQFHGQYPAHAYDYPAHQNYRPANVPYGYPMPMPPYPPTQIIPTRPAKDQDVGVGVRSVLLEEFRSNSKSNKRYELKVSWMRAIGLSSH